MTVNIPLLGISIGCFWLAGKMLLKWISEDGESCKCNCKSNNESRTPDNQLTPHQVTSQTLKEAPHQVVEEAKPSKQSNTQIVNLGIKALRKWR